MKQNLRKLGIMATLPLTTVFLSACNNEVFQPVGEFADRGISLSSKQELMPKVFELAILLIKHEVKEGVSLWQLSQSYFIAPKSIADSNQIEVQGSVLGEQSFKTPPLNDIVHEVKGDKTVETLSNSYGVEANQLKLSKPKLLSGQLSVGESVTIPAKSDRRLKNRQETEANYSNLIPVSSAEPAVLPSLKKSEKTGANYSTPISVPSSTTAVFTVQPAVGEIPPEQIYNVKRREPLSPKLPPLGLPEQYVPDSCSLFKGYIWPTKGVLTSGYGMRWGRMHKGVDIAGPVGTPIVAAAPGKVISAGWYSGGYGNLLKIKHSDGSITLYGHNSRILVRKGQKVSQGQPIALMGSTGYSTGPHLHFEIHPKEGNAANPMAFLPKKR